MKSDVDFAATHALHADHYAMVVFDHEKLEVYRIAVEYADAADGIAGKLKHGNAHIRDQLRRASDSRVNNIAEGAGEFQPNEKARFYRIALRSSTECAAAPHTRQRRALAEVDGIEAARVLLKRVLARYRRGEPACGRDRFALRVVEMLTRLVLSTARGP